MRHLAISVLLMMLLLLSNNPVCANRILKTNSFTTCNDMSNSTVQVHKLDITYDNDKKTVIFDVAGSNSRAQNVSATLHVTAYGEDIYSKTFNPCDQGTFVEQLCPIPVGDFAAHGSQQIPKSYADMVPAVAYQVPDIAAQASLTLKSLSVHDDDGDDSSEEGKDVACIQSHITNGKTVDVPAVSYVAAGVAVAALVMTSISAATAATAATAGGVILGGGSGSLAAPSPSFTEVFGWFQGMAMNGMLSVSYPPVYRSFVKNFGFSTGAIGWPVLQSNIDTFRASTGGNLTNDNYELLKNATLVFPDGSTAQTADGGVAKRAALGRIVSLVAREIETSVNKTASANEDFSKSPSLMSTPQLTVSGIGAYVEELSVPKSNIFMSALLIVAVIILAIAVGILLVKVILETWALFGNFPRSLAGFRKHYWGSIGRAITNLILLLYGVWVLYCIFQFTHGDSIAAKVLAAISLALFTGVLAFFSWKIWYTAQKLKDEEGDASALYEDKDIWVKYSLFYESYRKDYWWIFVPTIVYMFAKGCALAVADGHGMAQTIAQLVVEALMLVLLLCSRPYERKSGNIVNIVMQVVRVLSVACILVFVEEFGVAQTTKTVTGVVLIAVQSALTGILAILVAWNAINACIKQNPHRKRRKELERLQQENDTLTSFQQDGWDRSSHTSTDAEKKHVSKIEVQSSRPETFVPYHTTLPAAPRCAAKRAPSTFYVSNGTVRKSLTPTLLTDRHVQGRTAPFDIEDDRQPTLPKL